MTNLTFNIFNKIKSIPSFSCYKGDDFIRVAPFFRIYQSYLNNYDTALQTLNAVSTRELWTAFWEKCFLHPDVRGMSLQSFLIMPVQRIPRYQLLLRFYIYIIAPIICFLFFFFLQLSPLLLSLLCIFFFIQLPILTIHLTL